MGDLPSGPVVKIMCFQCRGRRFNLWSGNKDQTCCSAQPKINKQKIFFKKPFLNNKSMKYLEEKSDADVSEKGNLP